MHGPRAGLMPSRIHGCGAELSGLVPQEGCLLFGVYLCVGGLGKGVPCSALSDAGKI